MGNTLKMDKQDLLERLFKTGWSNRKIKRTTGIHRRTVAKYRKEGALRQSGSTTADNSLSNSKPTLEKALSDIQNAPLVGDIKCPPGQVGHFAHRP